MPYVKIKTLPEIFFAHFFESKDYKNSLAAHENCIEVTYVSEGSLTLIQDQKTFELNKNDFFCNLHHSVLHLEGKEPHEHHTIGFQVQFDSSDAPQPGSLSLSPVTKGSASSVKINSMIDEVIQTHTLHAESGLHCAGLFLQILNALHHCNKQSSDRTVFSNLHYTEKAKNYIYKHLSRAIAQNEIAEHLEISPQYLCSIFKKVEGVPLMTFINKVKLEKIKILMDKEHLKLYQAAELFGYTDPNYVSKIFKKYFCVNITDVRKIKAFL